MVIVGIFAVLMFLQSLMSTNFFINMLKLSVVEWFHMNACAPNSFIFFFGYLFWYFKSNPLIMFSICGNLMFFGGGGLMLFKWKGLGNILAQLNHIWMVSGVIMLYYEQIMLGNTNYLIYGSMIGMVVHTFWATFQQDYIRKNPILMDILMELDNLNFNKVQAIGVKEAYRLKTGKDY